MLAFKPPQAEYILLGVPLAACISLLGTFTRSDDDAVLSQIHAFGIDLDARAMLLGFAIMMTSFLIGKIYQENR